VILKIACQHCGHVGLANAETLPRELTCARCGSRRRVDAEDGARIVNRIAFEEWLFGERDAPS
jgi:DNA-directed RNA polymerase subunit RPC12/RpoP